MYFALAFANGLLAVGSRVVNAALSEHVGSLRGSLVNHVVGAGAVGLLLLAGLGTGTIAAGMEVAPIYWSGGVLGVLVVAASNYAVRQTGVTLFAVLILAFQLIGSALIDHFGWLGQSPIALSWPRLLGLGLLIGGALLVVTDRDAIEEDASDA
ncbi:MAG: DMT family transporter [Salinibacter sp.]